jgi:hypothetical protein
MGENLLELEGPIATKHPDIYKVKWRLKNFASLREFSYRSPDFKISGIEWDILVYPKVVGNLVLYMPLLVIKSCLRLIDGQRVHVRWGSRP